MSGAIDGAQAEAWICLAVGVLLVGAGVYSGLTNKAATSPAAAKKKIDDAKKQADGAKQKAHTATQILQQEGVADPTKVGEAAKSATKAANESADAAKSALEQAASIISSLPENIRFAGMLVLLGTILMSVATIQFGGTSIF